MIGATLEISEDSNELEEIDTSFLEEAPNTLEVVW
jgi:hypothetical protein